MNTLKTVDTVRAMIADGRHSAAEEVCRQQMLILPEGAESYILRGLLLTLEGRADEAVTAYDTALAFAPHALAAYQGIAQILADKGWHHSAVAVMENARQATNFTREAQAELDGLRTRIAQTDRQSDRDPA